MILGKVLTVVSEIQLQVTTSDYIQVKSVSKHTKIYIHIKVLKVENCGCTYVQLERFLVFYTKQTIKRRVSKLTLYMQ